jgi:hypothetical protein
MTEILHNHNQQNFTPHQGVKKNCVKSTNINLIKRQNCI